MFVVSEAAAIRAVFEQQGELSAAIELRRLFPGVTDNVQAGGMCSDHRRMETATPAVAAPHPWKDDVPSALPCPCASDR